MKKALRMFVLSLVVLTALFAVNRWDLPVMGWLGVIFGIVALVSGIVCFAAVVGI